MAARRNDLSRETTRKEREERKNQTYNNEKEENSQKFRNAEEEGQEQPEEKCSSFFFFIYKYIIYIYFFFVLFHVVWWRRRREGSLDLFFSSFSLALLLSCSGKWRRGAAILFRRPPRFIRFSPGVDPADSFSFFFFSSSLIQSQFYYPGKLSFPSKGNKSKIHPHPPSFHLLNIFHRKFKRDQIPTGNESASNLTRPTHLASPISS